MGLGRVFSVLALALVLVACAGERLQVQLPRAEGERLIAGAGRGVSDYRLMVGDKVRVTQYDVATETGEYTVDPAGAIIVPPLAPLVVAKIFDVIAGLTARGIAVVLVEQNARAALKLASRGYVLETGRVTLSGSGPDLAADRRVRDAYLGEG